MIGRTRARLVQVLTVGCVPSKKFQRTWSKELDVISTLNLCGAQKPVARIDIGLCVAQLNMAFLPDAKSHGLQFTTFGVVAEPTPCRPPHLLQYRQFRQHTAHHTTQLRSLRHKTQRLPLHLATPRLSLQLFPYHQSNLQRTLHNSPQIGQRFSQVCRHRRYQLIGQATLQLKFPLTHQARLLL